MMLAGVLAAVGVVGAAWWYSRRQRKAQRVEVCDRCGGPRVLLDEVTDDVHLNAGQRHEEQLGSVDYLVWWCGACESGAVVRKALKRSAHVLCDRCRHVTANEVSQTVKPANSTQGGEFRVHVSCQHCGHSQRFMRYTPRFHLRG